jgi:hypothetical protein
MFSDIEMYSRRNDILDPNFHSLIATPNFKGMKRKRTPEAFHIKPYLSAFD